MDIRAIKQAEATKTIVDNRYNGIVHVSPRVGKSKIAIDALNTIKSEIKVLILAPKLPILTSWKQEIKKWGLNDNISFDLVWSNSLKKVKDTYQLIICDEIHDYNNKVVMQLKKHQLLGSRILGLTGTLPALTELNLKNILKINKLYEYTFEEAIADGIIADYEIICVGCELDDVEDIEEESNTKNGKNPFAQTELAAYKYWNDKYDNIEVSGEYYLRKTIISKRKTIIYESRSKIKKTNELLTSLNRCLIFTGLQKVADLVGERSFHSKSNENTLEMFIDGDINKLSVVSKVSMGITIPDLKVAVFNQVKSNESLFIQQALRTMNLEKDKKATIYIVYLKNTQDEVWMRSAIEGFSKSKIKFI